MARNSKNIWLYHRLRKFKAALIAVTLTTVGIAFIMIGGWLGHTPLGSFTWLRTLPLGELGGTLFGAGVLGTLFEYNFRRDQEKATVDQFRDIIREQAPAMRDAVVDGFAIHPDDLKRVANPALLDDIATNVMALRLGDHQFAAELYAEIRDQAISSVERWYDVAVTIRLSTAVERSSVGTPLLDVTMQVEYTTRPAGPVRRFACVSDRQEYDELRTDIPTTTAWYITPRDGLDASSQACFELLSYCIDGQEQRIRRTARKTGQTYTVTLDQVPTQPVRVSYAFRTKTPAHGHRLFVQLPQPSRDMTLRLDYTDTTIASLRVTETVATLRPIQVTRLPEGVPGKAVTVEIPGWLLPKAGFAFTWTLNSELPRRVSSEAA